VRPIALSLFQKRFALAGREARERGQWSHLFGKKIGCSREGGWGGRPMVLSLPKKIGCEREAVQGGQPTMSSLLKMVAAEG